MRPRKPIPPHATCAYKGVIFEVWQWEQEMFDGTTAIFEHIKRPDTVVIAATVGDKILIEDEEQPGRPPFVTLQCGRIEAGEEPLAAAMRELAEETGYRSDNWTLWRAEPPDTSVERITYLFVARDCVENGEGQHLDAGEKITTRFIDFEQFLMLSEEPSFRGKDMVELLLRARLGPAEKAKLHATIFGA